MLSIFETHLRAIEYAPLILTIFIFIFTFVGWRFGHYRIKRTFKNGDSIVVGDSLMAAIFGLSALVLGFTFSGSASKYSAQMDAIRIQAQALGGVYDSVKFLDPKDQVIIRKSLKELLHTRLETYKNLQKLSDIDEGAKKIATLTWRIQEEVANAASRVPQQNKVLFEDFLVPDVKNLANVFAAGIINTKSHPPGLLMRFLLFLLCIGAFLIGYIMAVKKEGDWLLAGMYTFLIGLSMYIILSLEIPNILMPYEEVNRDLLLLINSF